VTKCSVTSALRRLMHSMVGQDDDSALPACYQFPDITVNNLNLPQRLLAEITVSMAGIINAVEMDKEQVVILIKTVRRPCHNFIIGGTVAVNVRIEHRLHFRVQNFNVAFN